MKNLAVISNKSLEHFLNKPPVKNNNPTISNNDNNGSQSDQQLKNSGIKLNEKFT